MADNRSSLILWGISLGLVGSVNRLGERCPSVQIKKMCFLEAD